MPLVDPSTAWEVYEKAGFAGLFFLMYVFTVGYLIRSLVKQQKDAREDTKMVVKALEQSVSMNERCADQSEQVSESVDQQSRTLAEFIAYLKGREGR